MQIVTPLRKNTMLALPVERLLSTTTSTTSSRLTSSPASSSEESSCPESPRPVSKKMSPKTGSVKLFSPLNVGRDDKTDRSPSPATNGQRQRDSDTESSSKQQQQQQSPQSPQQQALSLVKEEKSESQQERGGGGLVLVSPPKEDDAEAESSASILERMTTSIKMMETHLERNPPAASLFSSHLHNNAATTSDNESGGGSDHENNRPPSRPMSSASTTSTVASTALSPGSAAGFLHYHHYHYHFNNNNNNNSNDGAKSPKSNSSPTKAHSTTSSAASPSSRSSPTSSVNLKFSIDDILKPEFGKGAITSHQRSAKRPAVDTVLHNSSNDRRNRLLLHSPSEPPPSKSPRTFGNSRASSVKDFSEDSNGSTCTTASGRRVPKEEVVDETKVNPALPEGPMVWPAWVYCTRYSDRPSSGPRSRRMRKPEPGPGPKREPTEEKRPRTAFTADQLAKLKQEFDSNRYLTEKRRQDLANDLKLHENQIKIWFQNKRAKLKKSNGARGELALHLMSQGLYNHSTVPIDEDEEYEALLAAQQQGQVKLA